MTTEGRAPERADAVCLDDLVGSFAGVIPAVLATVSGTGVPNVTYLSTVLQVDHERIALSNQFFSKSARNLLEDPRASLLLTDPLTHHQHRLALRYERTDRRGQVFERLRDEVDAIAALTGMTGVFRLRAADVYRVVEIEALADHLQPGTPADPPTATRPPAPTTEELGRLCSMLSRCGDLDTLVAETVAGMSDLLGGDHTMLLLVDEDQQRLFTIASHGYGDEGVGSEVAYGEGTVGMAAVRCEPVRVGNLLQMAKYSRTVRRRYEASGEMGPGREVPVPGLARADSRLAVPAVALGQLVGVLVAESAEADRYTDADVAATAVVAALVAGAIEGIRNEERLAAAGTAVPLPPPRPDTGSGQGAVHVRFFAVDGSTFLDGDYLIKGVAGRLLWSLLNQHEREGRTDFTNREVRLDPTLDLPDFRDNLESRLILLKRRLDEREAPVRIEKTGRGRFRLLVHAPVVLERRDPSSA